ncbi:MAG: hypothetical protein D6734_03240 [Candidatus Schekmanbacteria bacterium]|nr:MAG: hypothetical protein D6734_03240 [Candidatus Schekmanbacteria bacterium]
MDIIKRLILFLPFPAAFFVLLFYPRSDKEAVALFILLIGLTFLGYFIYKKDVGKNICPWCGREVVDRKDFVIVACNDKENEKYLKFLNFIIAEKGKIIFFFLLIILIYSVKIFLKSYGNTALIIKMIQFVLLCLTGFLFIFFSSLYNRFSAEKVDNVKLPSFLSIFLLPGINIGLWALKVCGVLILIIASDSILPLMTQVLVAIF